MNTTAVDRRGFVQAGASGLLTASAYANILGANDRVGVGFIGYGLIGKRHVLDFREQPDVNIVAVAEVHRGRLDEAVGFIGGGVKGYGDFRKLLDDRAVDAVVVSTPDHWHALMIMNRRELFAAGLATIASGPFVARAAETRTRLGIVTAAFSIRAAVERGDAAQTAISDPLRFVELCRQFGAGGVQVGIGVRDAAYVHQLRQKLETDSMFLEGSIRLPRDRADITRFTAEVRTARDAGAKVLRTVSLGGRRYETFTAAEAFRKWTNQATQSLRWAEPVIAQHDMLLAVENHKDWRTEELVQLLKQLASKHVGVCVDVGNNLALLEDPLETVEALAPWAYSVHLKDMAVAEYEDGFLLCEVPLGEGFLDLKKIVALLRRARPEVRFGLEMITRNPLKVPCLKDAYWATFDSVPGKQLARALSLIRAHKPARPLPRIDGLSRDQQLALEAENIRKCMAYARQHLEL